MKTMTASSLAALAALTLIATGCRDSHEPSEAELLGYKGADLQDVTNLQFLVTGPTVTNWVPERLINVVELYELTTNELAVLSAAGALQPGLSYEKMPGDYEKATDEPWFAWWTKPVTSFGFAGKTGTLSHYDEDAKVWETSESYFSSYWPSREEALVALAKVRAELEKPEYGVKKFHQIIDGFVAEYLRLSVMCLVGQKADGTWSCMLDLRDKCVSGCGPWMPVEEQEKLRAQYNYNKAMQAWNLQMKAALDKNHELVDAAAKAKGIVDLEGRSEAMMSNSGRRMFVVSGSIGPVTEIAQTTNALETVAQERIAMLEKALKVVANGELNRQEFPGQGILLAQNFTNELYEAHFEAFMPTVLPSEEEAHSCEEGNCEKGVAGQWGIAYLENLQPGITLPERPRMAK